MEFPYLPLQAESEEPETNIQRFSLTNTKTQQKDETSSSSDVNITV